jgi:sugar phosphate isomerase/epimerase
MTLQSIGISAKTLPHLSLESNLEAVARYGLSVIQYDMACAGLRNLPNSMPSDLATRIGVGAAARGLRIAAVSGRFNMIHPDPDLRRGGLRALRVLAGACTALGTRCITLCSGTRDTDGLWHAHPDNGAPDAWSDLLESMEAAVAIAEEFDIVLGMAPAAAHVVDSAATAKLLLREIRSPQVKIVLDPAALLRPRDLVRQHATLEDAVEVLGPHIVMARARDIQVIDGEVRHVAAGRGRLDYSCYLSLVRDLRVPLILCGLTEADVPWSLAFLRATIEASDRRAMRAGLG